MKYRIFDSLIDSRSFIIQSTITLDIRLQQRVQSIPDRPFGRRVCDAIIVPTLAFCQVLRAIGEAALVVYEWSRICSRHLFEHVYEMRESSAGLDLAEYREKREKINGDHLY